MKIHLILPILILSLQIPFAVQARTEGKFLGQQFMINLMTNSFDGSYEDTAVKIYDKMNVSEQNSIIGLGKALTAVSQKELSFICSKRTDNSYQCSLIVFISAAASVGINSAVIQYTGESAKALYEQFHTDDDSQIVIDDDSGQFRLIVKPDLFRIQFQK